MKNHLLPSILHLSLFCMRKTPIKKSEMWQEQERLNTHHKRLI
ncbi:hypothetical protein HMPREF0636_0113 [Porphyromonas catoniae ATCC 51270]|uniref:Uncharacterized protein n=1 Tax=Porphyromonas catoniae ATCC 51270 TaxID=887901 RepID=Z4WPQ1_9PORP|nr:hypothetical protein HMPREF0636_0113 [Porphyromonas catoniae ATCC 51270]